MSARPTGLPEGMPWPPPRPPPMDPDEACREASAPRGPRAYQVWSTKNPRRLLSQHATLEEARSAVERELNAEAALTKEEGRKPRRRVAAIWQWPGEKEVK